METRIGIGYDIHRLVEGRKLFIGAVEIPYLKGLLGHSDGDVALHAICDGLLGAAGEDDIGRRFPDTDPQYHNIPSIEFLKKVKELKRKKNILVNNIDIVVIAQEPMLSPFMGQMRKKIAGVLNTNEEVINIKAKTNEGLGEIGRKEAIACLATVSLMRKGKR